MGEIDPWKVNIITYPKGSEVRVTDPDTGGSKGQKLARFNMIPPDVLRELAEHYGKGEQKYPGEPTGEANWTKGYDWRLSVDAMQRHFNAWLQGEDYDEETGTSHLVCALWHLFALRWFQLNDAGKDLLQFRKGKRD